jgi:hypothetical protein
LYVDHGAAVAVRSAPLGHVTRAGGKKEGPSRSQQLAPIVHHAAQSGAVLTVHATKKGAERLAACLAGDLEDNPDTVSLVTLAELRLGLNHPLVPVLRLGVAYHHAALPSDLQAEIEGAVRSGAISIVCSTTTLTEGVNLPVRTVIVCERGFYDGKEFHEMIDSADLMNAVGRAGRAGRETDGWIVIAREYGETSPRDALREIDRDQEIRSTLNVASSLEDLAAYEALLYDTAGVVLVDVPQTVDGFLAYCWYLADAFAALEPESRGAAVVDGIQQTLAWQQLPEDIRLRWEALARRVAVTFEETDPAKRGRWARSGARLSANAILESVAETAAIAAAGVAGDQLADPLAVLDVLLADGRLGLLLDLVPERDRRFKKRRYGATELAAVDVVALVRDWVGGVALADLVEEHLAEVESSDDDAFRFEQLSTFLTRVCEHHLPWTLGTILGWINESREEGLCPALPAYVHYGIASEVALELMNGEVRSRRLAVAVADSALTAGVRVETLRAWLTGLGASAWREDFAAGPAEVGDLLQFLHDPTAAIGGQLLDGLSIVLQVDDGGEWDPDIELPVNYLVTDEHPRPLAVVSPNGDVLASIRTTEHRHLSVLIDAGFQLLATPVPADDGPLTAVVLRADLE